MSPFKVVYLARGELLLIFSKWSSKPSVNNRYSWFFILFDLKSCVKWCLYKIDFVLTLFKFKSVYFFECILSPSFVTTQYDNKLTTDCCHHLIFSIRCPSWRLRDIQRWSALIKKCCSYDSALFVTWRSLNSCDSALKSAELGWFLTNAE